MATTRRGIARAAGEEMSMQQVLEIMRGLQDDITSFRQLSQLFREQYLANKAPPPVSYDLFDVKQYQEETLKEYINRFGAQVRQRSP